MRNPNRRQFLGLATATVGSVISAHSSWAIGPNARQVREVVDVTPRILDLQLQASVPLHEMRTFYRDVLGLRILHDQNDRLEIAAGQTTLTFLPGTGSNPFYHFAFNIPENKIVSALHWQSERTSMIPIPEKLRDDNYPSEVVNYFHWNAHSVFYLDPAGNVVEYIARHDLKNPASGEFDTKDLLYISEIGLIVDDVPSTASIVKQVVGIDQYRGGDDNFMALGDVGGLLLIMKRGRILNFDPSSDSKAARVFQTEVRVRGSERGTHDFGAFPYKIVVDTKSK
jgi:catechol 2,3-dioxygenase-like lactoylglutathione lyase family enzyme